MLHGAGHVSASVFDYPLLGTAESARTQAAKLSACARVVTLKIRPGGANAVRGALAVCAFLAALVPTVPAQSLPAGAWRGHLGTRPVSESIRRGMTVTGSYEPLYALQHSSAMLLNSALPQVCHGG